MAEIGSYREELQRVTSAESDLGTTVTRAEAAQVLRAAAAERVAPAEVDAALVAAGFTDVAGVRQEIAGGAESGPGRSLTPVPPRTEPPAPTRVQRAPARFRPTDMGVKDHEPGILGRLRDTFLEMFTLGRADTVSFNDEVSDEERAVLEAKASRLVRQPGFLAAYQLRGQATGSLDQTALRRDLVNALRISNPRMDEKAIRAAAEIVLEACVSEVGRVAAELRQSGGPLAGDGATVGGGAPPTEEPVAPPSEDAAPPPGGDGDAGPSVSPVPRRLPWEP